MRSLLSVLLVLAACGTDVRPPGENGDDDPIMQPVSPDTCQTSYLNYENFTAPFVILLSGRRSQAMRPSAVPRRSSGKM